MTFCNDDVKIAAWSPPEWSRNCFPLSEKDAEVITTNFVVNSLTVMVESVTEADTTPLGAVLHVAHILKTMQGEDGAWPTEFNARTGIVIGIERTFAPLPLFRKLNILLLSSEFEESCRNAEAGGIPKFVES